MSPKHVLQNRKYSFLSSIIPSLILLRNFGKIIFDISSKYNGRLELSQLRKLEKISTKTRKAELDVSFLESCQQFNVFPKFICFPLPNVNRYDVTGIIKRLLKSAVRKRCKEKRRLQNEKDRLGDVIKQVLQAYTFSSSIRHWLKMSIVKFTLL